MLIVGNLCLSVRGEGYDDCVLAEMAASCNHHHAVQLVTASTHSRHHGGGPSSLEFGSVIDSVPHLPLGLDFHL